MLVDDEDEDADGGDAGGDEEDDDDDVACIACEWTGDGGRMLLCDGLDGTCPVACHTYCCVPPLKVAPEGEWQRFTHNPCTPPMCMHPCASRPLIRVCACSQCTHGSVLLCVCGAGEWYCESCLAKRQPKAAGVKSSSAPPSKKAAKAARKQLVAAEESDEEEQGAGSREQGDAAEDNHLLMSSRARGRAGKATTAAAAAGKSGGGKTGRSGGGKLVYLDEDKGGGGGGGGRSGEGGGKRGQGTREPSSAKEGRAEGGTSAEAVEEAEAVDEVAISAAASKMGDLVEEAMEGGPQVCEPVSRGCDGRRGGARGLQGEA